jgi:alkylation response protein AidB-like acyl-CoA dehydrogenase
MELSEERQAFVAAIRDFCSRECGSREQREALTQGGKTAHSPELYAKVAELGWLGVAIPEAYGGAGGGAVDLCLFLEEIWRGRAPLFAFGTSMIVAGAYQRFGTEAQRRRMLGSVAAGAVHSIAMSEPEAGSDVASLACRAERVADSYVINGQKTWISNAHLAERILLVARTGPRGGGHEGITMLEVDAAAPGVEIRAIETMGGDEVNDVFFTDVEVPAEAVLGREGEAWRQLMAGLNFERLIAAASMLGLAQRSFEDVVGYCRERRQFGSPIGSFQVLAHRLADLATELHSCRLLVYDLARRTDADPERQLPREASMAKLKVTETAKRVCLEGVQMMGGYGYATEHPLERDLRASVAATIYGGTSEIQREIIARTYGLGRAEVRS